MLLRGEFDGSFPGLRCGTEMHASNAPLGQNQGETSDGNFYFLGSLINERANGGATGADEVVASEQSSQPVRLVDHFSGADAGEQIFISTRKANHFVRKHGPANQNLVIVEEQPVDLDQDGVV